jgi:hypothetical protein
MTSERALTIILSHFYYENINNYINYIMSEQFYILEGKVNN